MQTNPKKVNQLLAKDVAVAEREALMLYIVNLSSVYEGWGSGSGWSLEELKQFTARLREATEKHWPELWRSVENQNTNVDERAWEVILKLRKYLIRFWRADNDRDRDWYIHRAREYHYRLDLLPDLLKHHESERHEFAELYLDEPPKRNVIERALYELQKRAMKPGRSPYKCKNDDCEAPYFLRSEKGQEYCPQCRRSKPERDKASKRQSYHKNKNKWPSTTKRRKHRG